VVEDHILQQDQVVVVSTVEGVELLQVEILLGRVQERVEHPQLDQEQEQMLLMV
jgi:hypothetical protein